MNSGVIINQQDTAVLQRIDVHTFFSEMDLPVLIGLPMRRIANRTDEDYLFFTLTMIDTLILVIIRQSAASFWSRTPYRTGFRNFERLGGPLSRPSDEFKSLAANSTAHHVCARREAKSKLEAESEEAKRASRLGPEER